MAQAQYAGTGRRKKQPLCAYVWFRVLVKSQSTKKDVKSHPTRRPFVSLSTNFAVTSTEGSYDVRVNVVGGGLLRSIRCDPSRYRSCTSSSRSRFPRFR